jgi:hypothetical protein
LLRDEEERRKIDKYKFLSLQEKYQEKRVENKIEEERKAREMHNRDLEAEEKYKLKEQYDREEA